MPKKKKGRKTGSRSQELKLQHQQNPKMAEEKNEELKLQHQLNPKMPEEEIEELEVQHQQNPKIPEEEEGEELELQHQNNSKIPEEEKEEEEQPSQFLDLDPDQESSIQEDQQEEPLKDADPEESQGMAISPPPFDTSTIQHINVLDPPTVRKPKKRKKPYSQKQRAAVQKKLHLLRLNLQPIPFRPDKTLDFPKHEKLFRRLGLWDFAHLEFDREIRSDLLALLIANYNSQSRNSTVKDFRIKVSRPDLARALKLPLKKDKAAVEFVDSDAEPFSEESLSVIDDFMCNYILLHGDTWMMPQEILTSSRLLKEGLPHKIDWAGLIWYMVEKELSQVPESELVCYYASHLQCLMKAQRSELFIEEPMDEISMEEDDDAGCVKTLNMEDFRGQDLEDQQVELCLGQDKNDSERVVVEDVMDFGECKEEQGQWFLDGKNNSGEHCLQPCNLNEIRGSECEQVGKDEEQGYIPTSNFSNNLDRLASTDLIQEMETTNNSYGLHTGLLDPSLGELLTSRADMHKSVSLNLGGSSMFGNSFKREIDDDDDIHHFSQNNQQRKLRNDSHWGDHAPSDFDTCMEQVQMWIGKARTMHEGKEQVFMESNIHIQYLTNQVQQKDALIHSLEKSRIEERQKWHQEIYRLEREFCVMEDLLHGYKKALKETRNAFSEYRQRFQQPDEPLYKDVGGTGGLVLSTTDLEKHRLEKEEEARIQHCMIEGKLDAFQHHWCPIFDAHSKQVDLMDMRLLKLVEVIKALKVQKSE
ncbi:uncharacterized protein LOC143860587 [Tasmannia lanceolata]|uniref:uncharacterized protein LOC143860587 n=1 Tax=Tasmannia lanceolata TaxID=3420 RepID=UPI0040642643